MRLLLIVLAMFGPCSAFAQEQRNTIPWLEELRETFPGIMPYDLTLCTFWTYGTTNEPAEIINIGYVGPVAEVRTNDQTISWFFIKTDGQWTPLGSPDLTTINGHCSVGV